MLVYCMKDSMYLRSQTLRHMLTVNGTGREYQWKKQDM
jgi:hypothetical protein